jgi:predicted transposase/invertase (TIGR01784 family)
MFGRNIIEENLNMCQINPKIDLAFKKLFGSEGNKDILKSLINSMLSEDEQIVDLELKNPYNFADYLDGKLSILDIKAVDQRGRWYDIEMQVESQGDYGQRALYYWRKVYTGQIDVGELYYKLKETVVISLLNFIYFPDDERYHRVIVPLDLKSKEKYPELDFMALHFVELRKFDKELKNINTNLERWVTFLNRAYEYEINNIPEELAKDEAVKKAIETLDVMYLSKKEREFYELEQKALRSRAEELRTAIEEGREQGLEKGLQAGMQKGMQKGLKKGFEKGIEKGIEQGIEQGIEKGEINKALEMARKMKARGLYINTISEVSGLAQGEIETL